MADAERWVARIVPLEGTVADLLRQPHGLDVWERRADCLIAAADEAVLTGIERQGVARVERISTVRDYVGTWSPDLK